MSDPGEPGTYAYTYTAAGLFTALTVFLACKVVIIRVRRNRLLTYQSGFTILSLSWSLLRAVFFSSHLLNGET